MRTLPRCLAASLSMPAASNAETGFWTSVAKGARRPPREVQVQADLLIIYKPASGAGSRAPLSLQRATVNGLLITAVASASAVAQSSATVPETRSAPTVRCWCRRRDSRCGGKTAQSSARK